MSVTFIQDKHLYQSIDPADNIDWTSVTTLVSNFKESFDAEAIAIKCSKNKRSKWFGMEPEIIQATWLAEGTRAADLGHWYHGQRESDLVECETIEKEGVTLPIIRPIFKAGIKHAPEQKLTDGIYPEHFIYLKSAGLCGQSDRVDVVNGVVNINDYKTIKEIKIRGFSNWEGITKKMIGVVSHLDDCNLNHYALQLSLYLYMILKHNPKLKPGKLTLDHIIFEEQDKDKNGYPVHKLDSQGSFIVKQIVSYVVPYYKREVIAMINHLKSNPDLIKPKK